MWHRVALVIFAFGVAPGLLQALLWLSRRANASLTEITAGADILSGLAAGPGLALAVFPLVFLSWHRSISRGVKVLLWVVAVLALTGLYAFAGTFSDAF